MLVHLLSKFHFGHVNSSLRKAKKFTLQHAEVRFKCKKQGKKREFRKQKYVYSKLLLKHKEFQKKWLEITKLCLFHSFPTVYHLHQSNKRFENGVENTVGKRTNPRKQYLVYLKLF